jgi:glutamine amidotransferase
VSPVRDERRQRARSGHVLAARRARQPRHAEPPRAGRHRPRRFDEKDAPHISKQPIAAYGDTEFGREAREVSSKTFLAHIRFASTGALEVKNTHPFEQHGRLFAHNGVIEELPALDAHLGADGALVKGDTDSERFFALITREIAARDGDIAAGIGAACTWVAANLPLVSINFILATADGVWALRYPETDTLYLLERAPGAPLEHSSSLGSRVHSSEGVNRPLVVVASEPMDANPAWRLLAGGELINISNTLEVSTRQLLDHPPARLATL